tara:strand:+ start:968 stop:1483 length:516 start_codon:yes stop_codon:yes gene_type:complete
MHPQRTLIEAAELIVENVDKVEFTGNPYVPDRTVRVLKNPSPEQIRGLLNIADNKGHGAGGGGVRWFTNGKNLHVWHDTETVHQDVHEEMFGKTTRQYHHMETHSAEVDDNHKPIKGTQFASGSFLRPEADKPWHIGTRQDAAKEIITDHPAFNNLLNHDDGPRKIERFDT